MIGWLSMAFVVTLAKSPIYLPFAVAVLACRYRRLGWRGLWRRDLAAFAGCMLAALLLYHGCYVWANATAPGGADTPWSWYFGSWQERRSWHPYDTVLTRLAKQALPLAALPGLLLLVFTRRGNGAVVAAWALAATASSLLFLHVNAVHNYYQLPAAPALAAAAGLGLGSIDRLRWRWLRIALLLALGIGIVSTSQIYFERVAAPKPTAMQQAGVFLRAHTAPVDFVLIVHAETDAHPAPHYFAQRQGAIVAPTPLPDASLQAWRRQAAAAGGRLCCFVPHELRAAAAALVADWRLLAEGDQGALYGER